MADYAIHEETLTAIADTIRKKDATVALIDPADYAARINLMGMLEEKTVSGSVVAFSDGADDVPLKSCAVTIAPTLDGVSSVGVVSAGKNLFDKANPNVVSGYIDANSFNTGNTNAKTVYIPIKGGETYTVSKTAGQRFQIATAEVIPSSGALYTNRKAGNTASSIYVTAGDNDKYLWAWVFLQGTDTGTLEDMLASVQIEVGSAPTQYTAYTQTEQYTANLGRTIYGGSVDVVNGTGKTKVYKQTYTGDNISNVSLTYGQADTGYTHLYFYTSGIPVAYNPSVSNIITDIGVPFSAQAAQGTIPTIGECFNLINTGSGANQRPTIYWYTNQTWASESAFKTWLNEHPITVVYEVADEEDFTFTPVPIDSRLGDNTMWGDGDLSVVYRSSGTQTIIQPTLISKTVTENGTYTAADDNADGYDEVTVDVPTGYANIETVLSSNPLIEVSGVSGTDVSRTIWTYTASANGKIVFHANTQVKTNTGANDGYFTVKKNDTVIATTYANTSTTTAFSIPDIDIESGDVVTIIGGFDNYHTSCWFDIYSTITILS